MPVRVSSAARRSLWRKRGSWKSKVTTSVLVSKSWRTIFVEEEDYDLGMLSRALNFWGQDVRSCLWMGLVSVKETCE